MSFLKIIWHWFQKFAFLLGNFISGVFLFVFYYTIFALFATPFKIFSKPLASKTKNSNFVLRQYTSEKLEDFKNE